MFGSMSMAHGYKANAIALPSDDNALAIVSPPIGLFETDFAAIESKGNVTALVAPSSAHDLGQAEWQARTIMRSPLHRLYGRSLYCLMGLCERAGFIKVSESEIINRTGGVSFNRVCELE